MGTTTACYFASLHAEASLNLGKQAAKFRQRCLIGKVNMNQSRKDGYCETTKESIASTIKFMEDIASINVRGFYYLPIHVSSLDKTKKR